MIKYVHISSLKVRKYIYYKERLVIIIKQVKYIGIVIYIYIPLIKYFTLSSPVLRPSPYSVWSYSLEGFMHIIKHLSHELGIFIFILKTNSIPPKLE